ncbi:outer envelope pore protein 24, chloroplastic isoform X2 [Cajanus cajan]|uniref:outer envelope pore protein 24, chloroplastic isoform X1 n=1 Tax=Cajanus cajan TaxID=3821 RepID=UPI00098DA9E3|nr:outer envelope pore protein 24, chloroplastic isoform X1 [Cajanus cajan]XP_029129947.1 outer envelope pore protein 24, chloroplastic isoform X2 [Cajanus cajan]
MKATLKGKYDLDKNGGALATAAVNAGDVKFRASVTEATFINGPSLTGLSLAVEKPGSFIVDYNVPKKDFRFQFMNTVRVRERPLNLTYAHNFSDNRTVLDGTFVYDPANKFSANYALDSGNCKLKYTYVHKGLTTFEPTYDVAKNTWDFAVSQRVYGDDTLRATYQTSTRVLGLEWSRMSKHPAGFKIVASVNLAEELKAPKVVAETSWNFEM